MYQWQCGVVAIFLSVVIVADTVNSIPGMTIYMPLSKVFVIRYIKVITVIGIILMAFALSFNHLLNDYRAFNTMPYAIIKTLVWMLGDLGYDEVFLDDIRPNYPVQANILFLLFVTTIGGLVFNLILRDQANQLQEVKDKSAFYLADSMLKIHLLIDDCLPYLRRKYATDQIAVATKDHRALGTTSVFYCELNSGKQKLEKCATTNCRTSFHSPSCASESVRQCANYGQDSIKGVIESLISKIDAQNENIQELSRSVSVLRKSQSK